MAISSGDRLISLKTADGKDAVLPVSAVKAEGDRAILLKTADGYDVPIMCSAMKTDGQRGTLVQTADGSLVPVVFDVATSHYLMSSSYGVYVFDGTVWTYIQAQYSKANCADRLNGRLFFASYPVYQTGNNAIQYFDTADASIHSLSGTVGGMKNIIYALIADSSGSLYGAGYIYDYDRRGDPINGLGKWNGTSWSSLGSPTISSYYIKTLAVDSNDNLYAGGSYFSSSIIPGLVGDQSVVKWNGTSWSGICYQLGYCMSMAVDSNDNLYAGFRTNLGPPTYADVVTVRKYNGGSSWSIVGTTDAYLNLYDMCFDLDDNLYICGKFQVVNGVAASNIAKWNGTSWSALGAGMTEYSQATTIDTDGNVYFGGGNYGGGGDWIKKWDGTDLTDLPDGGINPYCYSLAYI